RAFTAARLASLAASPANLPKRTQAEPALCQNEANNGPNPPLVLPKRTQAETPAFAKTKPSNPSSKHQGGACQGHSRLARFRKAVNLCRPHGNEPRSATNFGIRTNRAR